MSTSTQTPTDIPQRGTPAYNEMLANRRRIRTEDDDGNPYDDVVRLLAAIKDPDGYSKKPYNYGQRLKEVSKDGLTLVFYGRRMGSPDEIYELPGPVSIAKVGTEFEVWATDTDRRLLLMSKPDPGNRLRKHFHLRRPTGFATDSGRAAGKRSAGRGPDISVDR